MKPWRTVILTIMGLMVLVACNGAEDVELSAELVDSDIDLSTETIDEAPEFIAQLDPNREYSQLDLSLVGTSGKPQFLNSYADW